MLQKFKITSYAFIICLFGFTLITVSPVFAEDNPEFVACQQIKPAGDFNLMKEKKNCFRNLARSLQAEIHETTTALPEAQAIIADLETQLSEANAAQEPLNAKIAELETQLSKANAAKETKTAKLAELKQKLQVETQKEERVANAKDLETQLSTLREEANTMQVKLQRFGIAEATARDRNDKWQDLREECVEAGGLKLNQYIEQGNQVRCSGGTIKGDIQWCNDLLYAGSGFCNPPCTDCRLP